jgi:hypothetical protein
MEFSAGKSLTNYFLVIKKKKKYNQIPVATRGLDDRTIASLTKIK